MEEMLLQQAVYSEIPMEQQYCLKFPGMEQVYILFGLYCVSVFSGILSYHFFRFSFKFVICSCVFISSSQF